MSDARTFMMGMFEATFPADRHYAKNHMWTAIDGETIRCGFAAYAVRLLQDVYFLEWSVDAPCELTEKQQIGFIESSKAESDLYSPLGGNLQRFNENLLSDPSGINIDMYGEGWLFEIQASPEELLSVDQYLDHLTSVWEITQKTIKGQLNQ
jgi:glycine cleavage system H protein